MTDQCDIADALVVRRADADDLDSVLELTHRALRWAGGADDARFFRWKHLENPFGASPMWIALDGERVVGLRAFLQWRFRDREGAQLRAVRAVDTATDPDYQGRGIFTRLTLGAIAELRAEGVALVFNTPNEQSLPGYLKMGWSVVGRLPTAVMLPRPGHLLTLRTARGPASLWSIEMRVGEAASDVLADRDAIATLLRSRPTRGIATHRGPKFLAWRYGYDGLRYRALLHGSSPADGLVLFRLRRRGSAVEAVVCDLLLPEPSAAVERSLLRAVARSTAATYLIRLGRPIISPGPFVRVPRIGPTLTCRRLDDAQVPPLHDWDLTLGDVELL